jgi:anti-anti-sigma factor
MQMTTEEMMSGITKVVLDGRLDVEGAQAIDLKMNVLAGSKPSVLIDMQKVSFLGSMGLRTIVTVARTIKSRGGRTALFAPDELVEKVLKTSGVDAFVPIHHNLETAMAALTAPKQQPS